MLDLRRLRVLRAVADHGSFAAAAAELDYTPSAVSQQIATLEREAGTVLVARGPRGARLTPAGAVLDRHAVLVLGQLAAARAELDDLASGRTGVLRLAAFESAWTALVPTAVAAFRERHAEVELVLAERDPEAGVARLRAGEEDLVLAFEPNGIDSLAGLERHEICRDRFVVVLPRDHRLAGRPAVALEELAGDPWVQPTAHCARLVNGACALAGFAPEVVFRSDDYGAIQGFVAAGAGVALVPNLALTAGAGRTVALPVAGSSPQRTIAAITLEEGPRPAVADAMLAVLRAAAAQLA